MLEVVSESTTEEVVDFEEWMVDTVSQSRYCVVYGISFEMHCKCL